MNRQPLHRTNAGRFGLALLAAALFALADAPAPPPPVNAAGIVVTTLIDFPIPVVDGECSLREAIINANADASVVPDCAAGVGADTITFSVTGAINLSTQLHPVISPAGLIIDGTGRDIRLHGGGFGSQFNVAAGAVAEVRALTFEDNPVGVDTDREGGGIRNAGTLSLVSVTVRANRAHYGGGVYNTGTLVVRSSTISGNVGNKAGGGVWNSGLAAASNSTISGNSSPNSPGAIMPAVPGSSGSGGGLHNAVGGSFVLANSTVTSNSVVPSCAVVCSNWPAGVKNDGALALINSVVAANHLVGAGDWDCDHNIEIIGPNLIGTLFQCSTFGSPPIVGDPLLGPLVDNGGPTLTHAPLPASPAIDAGDDARCAAAPVSGVDQRGVSRTQGAHCDLGSVELAVTPTLSIADVALSEGIVGPTAFTFTVKLASAAAAPVTVHVATANGTATAPGDYTAVPDTLVTFNPGETAKPFIVTVHGDTNVEVDETFFVNLSNPTGAPISDGQAVGTILTDDNPPIVGGKNLKIRTGSVDLSWDGGNQQTGYYLLRVDLAGGPASVFGPLATTATGYSDPTGPTSAVLCYILLPVGTSGLLGVSDLLCAQNSVDQGTVVAGAFTLSMNQSATTTLTWETPAGGADSYVLGTLPLAGGAAGSVALPGTATSTTHATGGAPYCYLLFGAKGGAFGVTDMLCGVPGISTLGAAGGRLASVEDAVAAVTEGLASVTLPSLESWRAGGGLGQ